ncbi:MAG: endonuclease [Acidimicrobiales bacterium]|nr:endonuclease [Acidimicrobiales bacterium]
MFSVDLAQQVVAVAEQPQPSDGALSQALLDVQRFRAQLDAVEAKLTASWDARQAWAADGAASGASWLAHHGEVSRDEARAQVRFARRLASMPGTLAALEAGEIGGAKAWLLARANQPGHAADFAADEALLVSHARAFTVDQLAHLTRRWLRVRGRDSQPDRGARSELWVSPTYDDVHDVRGALAREDGAIVSRALDALMREQLDAERGVTGEVRQRAMPERRAEALVEMARRSARVEPGGVVARPTVVAICDAAVLAGRPGEQPPFDGTCEVERLGPVSAETVRRLACEGDTYDVMIGRHGEVLDVGRRHRRATAAQRKALLVRDQSCSFPGCDRLGDWCEAHHIDHWNHGGATDLGNLCLQCRHHHHLVHEGRFRLARSPDDQLEFRRPDGRPIARRRPNQLPWRIRAPEPAGTR